ncbi:MAG: hypothetical protein JWR09_4843 [Mucilaginibacter sp.]|nr:hypothetical protein [Mucilaginibacter sp.]
MWIKQEVTLLSGRQRYDNMPMVRARNVIFFSGRDRNPGSLSFDYQLFADLVKVNLLIMSVFHSVPGVPLEKMERYPDLPRILHPAGYSCKRSINTIVSNRSAQYPTMNFHIIACIC